MATIFVETKCFGKSRWLLYRDTLWVKIFIGIVLSGMVFKKIQMATLPCGSNNLSKSLFHTQFLRYIFVFSLFGKFIMIN